MNWNKKEREQLLDEMAELRQQVADAKRTEERLQESEAKLRFILDHSTDLFYSHTKDNVVTYVSPRPRRQSKDRDCGPLHK